MFVDEDTSDVELVIGSLEDSNNFSHIIDRYESKLNRYIRGISGASGDDREDLLQEIFLSVYQNLNGYNPRMKFSSWIYRIAHNKTISWWRKNKKHNNAISLEDHQEFVSSFFNENTVQSMLDEEHAQEAIEYALSKMKPQYRQILVLAYFENRSYKEIAETTRSSVGTVGTRLKRARAQLIKHLQSYEQIS